MKKIHVLFSSLFFLSHNTFLYYNSWASLKAQQIKNLPEMQETQEPWVQSLGWEGPLEKRGGNPLEFSCLNSPMDGGAWQVRSMGRKESDPPGDWAWYTLQFLLLTGLFISASALPEVRSIIPMTLLVVFFQYSFTKFEPKALLCFSKFFHCQNFIVHVFSTLGRNFWSSGEWYKFSPVTWSLLHTPASLSLHWSSCETGWPDSQWSIFSYY